MKFHQYFFALVLAIFTSPLFADDTDIYLNNNNKGTKPYLMLTFDYRTDMTATYCGGNTGGGKGGGGNGGGKNKKKSSPTINTHSNLNNINNLTKNTADLDAPSPLLLASAPITTSGTTSVTPSADCAATLANAPELLAALTDLVGSGGADNLDAALAVFKVVFAKFDGIYVGLMMSNNTNGGTILRGYKEFQANDANGAKQEIIDILASIPRGGNGANFFHKVSPKETHYELFRYLNGHNVLFGTDTTANFQGSNNPSYDASIINNGRYISPFDGNEDFSCARLYEVYATSGNKGTQDNDADALISSDMNASATDPQFTGMVDYMTNNDLVAHVDGKQTLKSWYIQMGTAATKVDDWASAAGTADQLMVVSHKQSSLLDVQTTLEAAFIEALSVSATFVSASVPVNVFNRIQTLDNFYIALFEAKPNERWNGNIKKLKMFDRNNDGAFDDIVDANNLSAFNSADGRIKYEALTFWTDSNNLPAANPEFNEINGRDGRSVIRGGAGQKIPEHNSANLSLINASNTRQLYVEPAIGNTFEPLNADGIAPSSTAAKLQTLLEASSITQAQELIAWARGKDIDDEDADNNRLEAREWLLADAIHSRPLAINYGATNGFSKTDPQIRLFMGTNDGFFHILENTKGSLESGEEIFAFIPRESLKNIKKLRENLGANKHPYGVDGAPVALVKDNNNNGTIETDDQVLVYVGMRRGGHSYFALDASNPNTKPTFKWKLSPNGNFTELGLTFSTPAVTKVKFENTLRDVLIFGGGYDERYDTPIKMSEAPGLLQGAAIFIVDAQTGELIWKVSGRPSTNGNTHLYHQRMEHSIPSNISTFDSNQNGITDRLYVGDLSGIVWRIDLPEGFEVNHRQENWTATILADLDDDSENEDRRMFHAPDIIQTSDEFGPYDGILISTGDRANPLETTDQNYSFLIKDRNIKSGTPPNDYSFNDDNITDVTGCVIGTESTCVDSNLAKGWKIALQGTGEKGLSSPIVAAGKVFFTSYIPSSGSGCEPSEGSGFLYAVNLNNGSAAYPLHGRPIDIGPGIPPGVSAIGNDTLIIPSAGIVKLDTALPSNDKTKLIQAGGKPLHIIYWRETNVDSL